jgi:NAD(P)-dependent dehydrogenase (short-subunit alcohol dehydrogenase family)
MTLGRLALVTGAGREFGLVACRQFARLAVRVGPMPLWRNRLRRQGGFRRLDGPDYLEFAATLRKCGARILAFAGDADLFFVGRSPGGLFDYLSGILLETPGCTSSTCCIFP